MAGRCRWYRGLASASRAAACFLLVVLMVGIGLIVAFVLDAPSLVSVVVGASLAVLAWHGLRSIEPRPPKDLPGKCQAAILEAEQNRPKLRLVSDA